MKTSGLISRLLMSALLMQGCAKLEESFAGPLNMISGRVDRNCPSPSKEQLNNGYLMLQKGVTLKCQVKNHTSNLPCTGITDSTKMDGWLCDHGKGKILFIFDEDEILKDWRDL